MRESLKGALTRASEWLDPNVEPEAENLTTRVLRNSRTMKTLEHQRDSYHEDLEVLQIYFQNNVPQEDSPEFFLVFA